MGKQDKRKQHTNDKRDDYQSNSSFRFLEQNPKRKDKDDSNNNESYMQTVLIKLSFEYKWTMKFIDSLVILNLFHQILTMSTLTLHRFKTKNNQQHRYVYVLRYSSRTKIKQHIDVYVYHVNQIRRDTSKRWSDERREWWWWWWWWWRWHDSIVCCLVLLHFSVSLSLSLIWLCLLVRESLSLSLPLFHVLVLWLLVCFRIIVSMTSNFRRSQLEKQEPSRLRTKSMYSNELLFRIWMQP